MYQPYVDDVVDPNSVLLISSAFQVLSDSRFVLQALGDTASPAPTNMIVGLRDDSVAVIQRSALQERAYGLHTPTHPYGVHIDDLFQR